MTCSGCGRKFESADRVCPYCGASNAAASGGVVRTSTVLISSGRTAAVYRSVREVPDALRKKLLRSTSGLNAATILIADRRGREELAKAIRRLPAQAQGKLMKSLFGESADGSPVRWLDARRRKLAGAALAMMTALVVWLAATWPWGGN